MLKKTSLTLVAEARVDAPAAALPLHGGRAARADELAGRISDALRHLHRLARVLDEHETKW